jgi:small conductance mechanosensitive channel
LLGRPGLLEPFEGFLRELRGHVPNSEIQRVANEMQIRSHATLDLGVAYSSDLDDAIAVLERAVNELAAQPEWVDHIKEPPEVQGIQGLGEDVVVIRSSSGSPPGIEEPLSACYASG